MASSFHVCCPQEVSKTIQTQRLEPYTTLGQLSYAPTTQTTVVTTTTTTTTSFPPLLLNAPQQLHLRDPKLYPLACSPTPEFLKDFQFNIGGRLARFREADDAQQTLQECDEQYAALKASGGAVSTATSVPRHEPQARSTTCRNQQKPAVPTPSIPRSRKRSSSPVSIAEAAQLAGLARQRKKSRIKDATAGRNASLRVPRELGTTTPATPDTDAGSSRQLEIPKLRSGTRRPVSRASSSRAPSFQGDKRLANLRQIAEEWRSQEKASTSRTSSQETSELPSLDAAHSASQPRTDQCDGLGIEQPIAGISATPPIADTDMEPFAPLQELDEQRPRNVRPSSLQTVVAQDASLPSPSLSPITAAANLANNSGFPGSHNTEDDDENDVSSLDIEQDQLNGQNLAKENMFPTPNMMDMPVLLDTFDSMPEKMKTYVMYQLLRRCPKSTLHVVADVVNPALKIDFLGLLPLELSLNILQHLDAQSMCRASQVSKKWRHVVNSDEAAWKNLLEYDGYQLPHGELERAVREGWGWQFPFGPEGWEKDIREPSVAGMVSDSEASQSTAYAKGETTLASTRGKRKATVKSFSSSKRQRRKGPAASPPKGQLGLLPPLAHSLDSGAGPNAYANAAALAVPHPKVGLASLRNLHLFKSLYQRHHMIRKSWMDSDTQPQHLAFRAHQRHVVTCLQFDTDKILTGSDDTNINVYDTKTGALRSRLQGHEGGVWALQYDGNVLVSGSTDRSVRVWDIERGRCLQVFQGHTSTVRCLVILQPTEVGKDADGNPIMAPDQPLIITGSRDSTLRVWKLPKSTDQSIIQTGAPANERDNPYFIRTLNGHHHSVRAIAAHGDTLVSGSYDCSVRVWKISTGETLHRLTGHTQKVYSVVLDHGRNRCVSGSMDCHVKVWSLDSGQCLHTLEGHSSLVGLLDLSHDRLVSAAADSTLRIWDPENGQCKATLTAHTGAITCFQHDGQKVVSGSDRTLKMWDVKTGECVKDLLTDLSGVWQVKFNERRCVAAVQRNAMTYIEVLDFGASRDGVPADKRGRRIVVDSRGLEVEDVDDNAAEAEAAEYANPIP
ncbi:WD40 repeat-like protein [Saccharata proteae CBS 121410]|uniref:WD40 repeat-like protein n=1 Tax=Saccharata proteae CBS 121410 TaxID=1314787 RepID=A0A6A5YC53_9PEZI|nr:WD40 repeat-like protein [Saccharata proteae CBS 121410]